jgi:hypothetical protein
VRRSLGEGARPGIVVSIATAGELVQWHPHLQLLVSDGGKPADGSWQPLPRWDGVVVMELFRERPRNLRKDRNPSCARTESPGERW